MSKILILEASPRTGFCSNIANRISKQINEENELEILTLRSFNINMCRGCTLCLSKGSSKCMFYQDDVKEVLAKLKWADGIIFVVPNYALGVPGILKNLFDRLAYLFHRPRLFHKFCIPIVVQGVYGGKQIAKYINEVMGFWGMEPSEGVVVRGGLELSDAKLSDNDILKINKATKNFVSIVKTGKSKTPSFFRLLIFRSTRTSMVCSNEVLEVDKKFYVQNGWTKSDYFYEIKLTFIKRIVGRLADAATRRMILKDKKIKREINS